MLLKVTDDEAVASGSGAKAGEGQKAGADDDSSDDDGPRMDGGAGQHQDSMMSDFDMMLERKKAEQRRRRRKKDIDLINDNDDAIAKMIADMKLAARCAETSTKYFVVFLHLSFSFAGRTETSTLRSCRRPRRSQCCPSSCPS